MMKKIFILFCLPLYLMAVNVDNISKKIDTIKSSHRVSPTLIYDVYDPFIQAKPIVNIKKKKKIVKKRRVVKHIVIQTVFNDKILVNNRWYKEGDKVMGLRVKKIYKNSALIGDSIVRVSKHKSILQTKEIIQ